MVAMGLAMHVCNRLEWPPGGYDDGPRAPFPMIPLIFHTVFVLFLGQPVLLSLGIWVLLIAFSRYCY